MFKQAGKLSSRSNGGSNNSNGGSNAVVTLSSSNKVVVSSVVRAIRVALILNLDKADDGLSSGEATTS